MRCNNCGQAVPDGRAVCPQCGAILHAATLLDIRQASPEQVLSDRYVLLALLGRGGMGAVFLAKDTKLDELIALKTLPVEFATDLRAIEWMKEEVRLARSLAHSNIMRVYDFQTDTYRGVSFITMEFVDGVDLATLALGYEGRRLPLEQLLLLLDGAAAAIDFAHSQRIIHRDIKPKNIMVDRAGRVKVTDFGIAKRLRDTMSKISQTSVAGTPAYMSPEAVEGKRLDSRADVYSFGATVYELLTSSPPFSGSGMQIMFQVLRSPVPEVTADRVATGVKGVDKGKVAAGLTEVLRRCMAKEAGERYESCEEFVGALVGAMGAEVLEASRSDGTRKRLCGTIDKVLTKQRQHFGAETPSIRITGVAVPPSTPFPPPTPQATPTVRRDATYEMLVGAEKERREILLKEADAAEKRGDLREAISYLEKALDILGSEELEDRIERLKERYAEYRRHRKRAEEAERAGELEKALAEFEEALKYNPDSRKAKEQVERVEKVLEERARKRRLKELREELSAARQRKDWERMLEICDELKYMGVPIVSDRKDAEKALEDAKSMLYEAQEAWEKGALEKAHELVKMMRAMAPILTDKYKEFVMKVYKGWASMRQAKEAEAIGNVERALRIYEELKLMGIQGVEDKILRLDLEAARLRDKRKKVSFIVFGVLALGVVGFFSVCYLTYGREMELAREALKRGDFKAAGVHARRAHQWALLWSAEEAGELCDTAERCFSFLNSANESLKDGDYWKAKDLAEKVLQFAPLSQEALQIRRDAMETVMRLLGRLRHLVESDAGLSQTLHIILQLPLEIANNLIEKLIGEQILGGHSKPVTSVSWSPNGHYIASGSSDKTIRIWDTKSNFKCVATLTGHTHYVLSVSWSPDGRYLASSSLDKTVRIWDVPNDFICVATLKVHTGAVWSVSWSPDKRYLAGGGGDIIRGNYKVWIWDAKDNYRYVATLTGHMSLVRSVSWSPDGRYLASGSGDKTVRIWDAKNNFKCVATLRGHTNMVNSVSWSPDGCYLASGSSDKTVRIWNAKDNFKCVATLEGHTHWVLSVSWGPDGRYLASGSADKTVRIWDIKRSLFVTLSGHIGGVLSVSWSSDGCYLASGVRDCRALIHRISKEKKEELMQIIATYLRE